MIDLEKIRALYKFGRNLSLSEIQVLFNKANRRSYKANEFLFQEGSHCKEVFFIRKGLIRCFLINEKGEEITTLLRWENQIAVNADIVLFDRPSRFYFQAMEETDVFSFDYDALQELIVKHPKLENNRKFVFQKVMKQAMERIESFVLLTPEERYTKFVETNPQITNRVPNKYIANVLGITPVSLSRIRKRISQRGKNDIN